MIRAHFCEDLVPVSCLMIQVLVFLNDPNDYIYDILYLGMFLEILSSEIISLMSL